MGHLQHVWEQYKKKGVVILGFNASDDKKIAGKFLREKGITFPNVLDASTAAQTVAWKDYKGSGVPLNYIIDRDGTVAAGFSGYAEGDLRGIEVLEEALAGVSETATDSGGLVGTVLGPQGEPLAGASVALLPTLRWYKKGRRQTRVRTDAEGRYEFMGVLPAAYDLQVQVFGLRPYVAPLGRVYVRPGLVAAHPVRVPDSSISGRITRKDTGKPLGRRDVHIRATPVEVRDGKTVSAGRGRATAWADDDGRYTFVGLLPGMYKVSLVGTTPGLKSTERVVELEGDRLERIDFRLEPQQIGMLRVRVLEPDGKPATAVRFSRKTGPSSVRTMSGREVKDGVYEVLLSVGDHEVSAWREGVWSDPVKVTIRKGKVAKATLRLRAREDR